MVQRENGEKLVLYHHETDANPWSLWARPLEMFLGYKEIDGENVRRFSPVNTEQLLYKPYSRVKLFLECGKRLSTLFLEVHRLADLRALLIV